MNVVIADTSPLNYLSLVGHIDILRALYGRVIVPPEVMAELAAKGAPAQLVGWIQLQPEWLEVRAVPHGAADSTLQQLGPGERAAILLAQEESGVLLLIDDAAGRAEANRRQIPNTGTLGILRAASLRRLLDLPTALAALAGTNFRVSDLLVAQLLAEHLERKRQSG